MESFDFWRLIDMVGNAKWPSVGVYDVYLWKSRSFGTICDRCRSTAPHPLGGPSGTRIMCYTPLFHSDCFTNRKKIYGLNPVKINDFNVNEIA